MIVEFSATLTETVIYVVKQPVGDNEYIVHYHGNDLDTAMDLLNKICDKGAHGYLCMEVFMQQC